MFVIKAIICFILLLALILNGFNIFYTANTPLSEKLLNFMVFVIITLLIGQFIMSYSMHYIVKNKKGYPGELGISGQFGKLGEPGKCVADCGKKVCFRIIEQDANNALTHHIKLLKKEQPKMEESIIKCATNTMTIPTTDENKNKNIELPKIDLDVCKIQPEINMNETGTTQSTKKDKIECVSIKEYSDELLGGKSEVRYRIKNKIFLNKLSLLCNSKQYLALLEKNHKNKPTEKKLIEYISSIVIKWIERIVNFYFNVNGEKVYLGIIFLMSPDSPLSLIENITINTGNEKHTIQSPLREIEKYDIWNWGELYVDNPLLVKTCFQKNTPPLAVQQKIKTIFTNNYDVVFSSLSAFPKDIWDVVNCPYGQMGNDRSNPENLKTCINQKSKHEYSKKGVIEKTIAWKKQEYKKNNNITFLHPKFTMINSQRVYHQDKTGKKYYPVGSVWTTHLPNKENKYGKKTILVAGDIKPPVSFELIWKNTDIMGHYLFSAQNNPAKISLWRPIAPDGYVSLGDIAVSGDEDLSKMQFTMGNTPIVCVNKECIKEMPMGSEIWNAEDIMKINYKSSENFKMNTQ